jgi:hypothetical protein
VEDAVDVLEVVHSVGGDYLGMSKGGESKGGRRERILEEFKKA